MKKIKLASIVFCLLLIVSCSQDDEIESLEEQLILNNEGSSENMHSDSSTFSSEKKFTNCNIGTFSDLGFHILNTTTTGYTVIGWDFNIYCPFPPPQICPPGLIPYEIQFQGFFYDFNGTKIWDPNMIYNFISTYDSTDANPVFQISSKSINNIHLESRFRIRFTCHNEWSDWVEFDGTYVD